MIVLINAFMPKTSMSWKSIWIYLKSEMFFFISSENLFQTRHVQSGTMCVYSTWSRDKIEYTYITPLSRVYVWNKFWIKIKLFHIWNWIISRHRSLGHESESPDKIRKAKGLLGGSFFNSFFAAKYFHRTRQNYFAWEREFKLEKNIGI